MSHLTMLATRYSVQYVNPYLLWDALDCSTDLDDDAEFDSEFAALLGHKYNACTEWFKANLREIGIQEPVVVIILPDGRWMMDEGHHRLADALVNYYDVPVIFDDTGAGLDSTMGFDVARPDVSAYHFTINDCGDSLPRPRRAIEN